MDDEEIQEKNQFEKLIQGLIDDKYGCCNDFLLPKTMAGLRTNIATLNASGNMKSAGIGNKVDFQKDKLIRSDKINWIEEQSTNPYEEIYLRKIWRFIVLYLNQDWKVEDEGMLSLYPIKGEQKNISPLEGRMVFFRSDEMEHKVHPSLTRERRSIAGW